MNRAAHLAAQASRLPAAGRRLRIAGVLDIVTRPADTDLHARVAALANLTEDARRDVEMSNLAGVAYALRADVGGDAIDYLRAIEHFEEALAFDTTFTDARANLALVLVKLGMHREARRQRNALPGAAAVDDSAAMPVVSATPVLADSAGPAPDAAIRAVRDWITDRALPTWAATISRGDTTTSVEWLARARLQALSIFRRSGDRSLLDAIDSAAASRGVIRAKIITGVTAYQAGRAHARRAGPAASVPMFEQAHRELEATGSPLGGWALLHIGVAAGAAGSDARAFSSFGLVANAAEHAEYRLLAAYAHRGLAIMEGRRGRLEAALAHQRRSAELFEAAGDTMELSDTHWRTGEVEMLLGRARQAFAAFVSSLEGARRLPPSLPLLNTLMVAGAEAHRLGFTRASIRILHEAIHVASATGVPGRDAEARVRLAAAYQSIGDDPAAAQSLALSRAAAERATDPTVHAWSLADAAEVAALLRIGTDPLEAARLAGEAVQSFALLGSAPRELGALALRGRAYRAAGMADSARVDLELVVERLERPTGELQDVERRIAAIEMATPAFDELIAFHVESGDQQAALETLEQARRLLTRPAQGKGRRAPPVIPAGTTVVTYAVTADAVHGWALDRNGAQHFRLNESVLALRSRIDQLERVAVGAWDSAATADAARELHRLLLGPIKDRLRGRREWVIVPDKFLHRVPYAALVDGDVGRYVIEDHVVRFASSVEAAMDAGQPVSGGHQRALLIGAPHGAGREDLPRLRSVGREIGVIATGFAQATTLQGEHARPDSLLARLPGVTVVHFAGHAVLNEASPALSHLVLSGKDDSGSAAIYPAQLRALDLRAVSLVVLAACSTSGAPSGRIGGLSTLAGAFLLAGARTVAGSIWPVDDEATTTLLIDFHRAVQRGASPAASLREAQLAAIRRTNRDPSAMRVWASFRVEG